MTYSSSGCGRKKGPAAERQLRTRAGGNDHPPIL
nr:MAG TPA: hypothetical protein [Caudoviricetes sp.]